MSKTTRKRIKVFVPNLSDVKLVRTTYSKEFSVRKNNNELIVSHPNTLHYEPVNFHLDHYIKIVFKSGMSDKTTQKDIDKSKFLSNKINPLCR